MACGIGMSTPESSRLAPRHYGINVSEAFAGYKHNHSEAVIDEFHGRPVVQDQLIWLIRKGDLILPDEPLRRKFAISCKFSFQEVSMNKTVRMTFAASNMDEPPSSLSRLPKSKQNLVLFPDL
jgi:hypothetical protein